MDAWKRQTFVTRLICAVAPPVFRQLLGFRFESVHGVDGSFLLLCNHVTDYDPVLLNVAAGRPMRFVASEHILRKGLGGRLLKAVFQPIIITKGVMGMKTTMQMLQAMRAGQPVGLFPEGNRSFNGMTGYIPPVTGKLAKKSGVSLVTYRLSGGYFTQPRWGFGKRKGKFFGRQVNVYTPEQLAAMTDEEITGRIREDLHEDAYALQSQEKIVFRGKQLAKGLETVLFCCPKCGKMGTLTSDETGISCTCGASWQMDAYGTLQMADGESVTVTDWDDKQRRILAERKNTAEKETVLFSDKVTVQKIGEDHEVAEVTEGLLEALPDAFRLNGQVISVQRIAGAAIHSRNGLTVHMDKEQTQYEIIGQPCWNALKYIYLYHLDKNMEMF